MKFAENTSVAVTKTKQELEVMVTRAGATHFGVLNKRDALRKVGKR